MSIHVFTSVTCNYLPKARVLAHSLKRWHPEVKFHLLLVDAVPTWLNLRAEPFDELIEVSALEIPEVEQWLFKHTVVEACTAVKGAALSKLLRVPGCSGVLYFDPDIALLSPMDDLLKEFETASVLLTPHLTEPETTMEAILDNEFSVLRHGIYNLGFVGVKNCPAGRRFAQWWADRLYEFCYDDIPRGIFTDQRWVDLAPACFDDVRILRGPGYNVATWNLTHRKVTGTFEEGFFSNRRPLVFYHFSGFDSGAQEAMLNKYGSAMPTLFELRKWYITECERMGQTELGSMPWSYANYDNGQTISKLHRKRYRERGDLQRAFPDPYCTREISKSYYHWFEANDESKVTPAPAIEIVVSPALLPAKAQASSSSPGHPRYRIVISVRGVGLDVIQERVHRIVARTYSTDLVYLVGTNAELAMVKESSANQTTERLAIAECVNPDADLTATLGLPDDRDLLFVRATAQVPIWWDLRLAWSALRNAGICTVSPINVPSENLDERDITAYASSLFVQPSISTFSRTCVYIRRAAIRDAGLMSTPSDFLARTIKLRWSHVLADHVCVAGTEEIDRTDSRASLIVEDLRKRVPESGLLPDLKRCATRRQLHVLHSWGGGLEHWVRNYCRNDSKHDNLVLKSIGTWGAFGQQLWLYRHMDDPQPIRRFPLSPPISHTADRHGAYRTFLEEICHEYGIDAIVVSSLIGHSLDVLRSGLPTLMVCHDYYPFCPALNITFNSPCKSCGERELQACTLENPHHRFFQNIPTPEWLHLRSVFSGTIRENGIRLIAPSPSVVEGYCQFLPELREYFQVIPHGTRSLTGAPLRLEFAEKSRLRLVVLGSLAPHKGGQLLQTILGEVLQFADLYLVGCGEWGSGFAGEGVTVIPSYTWEELSVTIKAIRPHVGLLLSVVPETFSYTLRELAELAIPTVATRIGSFADYIEDEVNGFLVDPEANDLLSKLKSLTKSRDLLLGVHNRLKAASHLRIPEMVARYEANLSLPDVSANAYFAAENRRRAKRSTGPNLQLFWRPNNRGFEEEFSTQVHLAESEEPYTAVLDIPPSAEPLASVRLDLDYDLGFVRLHRLSLMTSGREILWSWTHRHGVLKDAVYADVKWLDGEAGALLCIGPDPRIILPAQADILGGATEGVVLEVEISSHPLTSALTLLIASSTTATSELERGETTALAHRIGAKLAKEHNSYSDGVSAEHLLDQVVNLRARVTDLEHSISWRITAPLRRLGHFGWKWKTQRRDSRS